MTNQLLQGQLERWDDNKGFGFIRSDNNPKGIFVHISAFNRNISRRPLVGDIIFYELHTDYDGKSKAVNARIAGVSDTENPHQSRNNARRNRDNSSKSGINLIIVALVVLWSIAVFLVNKYQSIHETKLSTSVLVEDNFSSPLVERPQTKYSCQGKVYCTQMSSCEEAQFYQSHCSGTKMDGDGDGIPCEDQWCGH